jgi:hypothetical protein
LPSYHSVEAAVGEVPPTAHPEDPLERYTPSRIVGVTRGKTDGAFVQLMEPPSHLRTVGSFEALGVPTAHPSESLSMNTELRARVFGEVVVLQIESDTVPQFAKQKVAMPDLPTAQTFPPEVAKVTESRPPEEAI